MAAEVDYRCDTCKKKLKREECVAKKVQYATMGASARILRMRTVGWVCVPCMRKEQEYNTPFKGRVYLKDEDELNGRTEADRQPAVRGVAEGDKAS